MTYRSSVGETEFGGVLGPFPEQQRAYPSMQQEVWSIYATDEGGGLDEEGADKASIEWGADHIGEPRQSFTIAGAEPDLTAVAPWDGSEETA